MAKSPRKLTDELSFALAAIDAALLIIESVREDPAQFAKLVKRARDAGDEAHVLLVKIKEAAGQI